jgi:hypothetical protein
MRCKIDVDVAVIEQRVPDEGTFNNTILNAMTNWSL